ALAAPFLVGIVRLVGALALSLATQVLPAGAPGKVDLAAAPRRALVVALQLAAAVALGLPLFAVARAFLPLAPTLALFAAAFVFLGIRLWLSVTQLQGHVRAGAQVLAAAFSQARGAPATGSGKMELEIGQVLPGLGSPVRFALSQESPAVGRTLATRNLRCRVSSATDVLRVALQLPADGVADVRVHHPEPADADQAPGDELLEFLGVPQGGELAAFAANEDEAVQVTAVRREQARLERIDRSRSFLLGQETDERAEQLQRVRLPPHDGQLPADEQSGIR